MNSPTKPKLVFFQYRYDETLPEFLLIHKRDHVKCLEEFFDVTVITEDSDYQQVCDTYEPAVTLFESGIDNLTCRKPNVTNTRVNPGIPKLALHNADAFSGARAGFLSDMEHWGIETFFSICVTTGEHTPEIAGNLFSWPNFIDPEIYRDYGEWKSIPVLLTGNRISFYPWRQKVFKLAARHFPALSSPHPGYSPGRNAIQFLTGERYARTINASSIVPACGTVMQEVVRKHFEIPACRACLVAQRSPALEAAGYVDMENCVFADEHDVVDKLTHLFSHPDELERVTDAGYRLVHARHTMKQRSEIFQWYTLNKNRRPGDRIIQVMPFAPLTTVPESEASRHFHVSCNGVHLQLLHQANAKRLDGKYDEAEKLYLKCLNYLRWLPEANLGLAICNLHRGNVAKAVSWLEASLSYVLGEYGAKDPDPVEWAYFIVCSLGRGNASQAREYAAKFPALRHPELDRARWAANVISASGAGGPAVALPQPSAKRRSSLHPMPERELDAWVDEVCSMLRACGQTAFASTLAGAPRVTSVLEPQDPAGPQDSESMETPAAGAPAIGKNLSGSFSRRLHARRLKASMRRFASRTLHRAEATFGYFLPYHLSEKRHDEFYSAVQEAVSEDTVKSALLIGAATGEGCTEAFMTGARDNESNLLVFCVGAPTRDFGQFRRSVAARSGVKTYQLSGDSAVDANEELETTIQRIKEEHQLESIDLVLLDSSRVGRRIDLRSEPLASMFGASVVLLDDINDASNFDNHHRLLDDSGYELVAANPGLRNGYAIFRKVKLAS